MFHSLKQYAINSFYIHLNAQKKKLLHAHFWSYYFSNDFKNTGYNEVQRKAALDKAINWLLLAQQKTFPIPVVARNEAISLIPDKGFASYHLVNGWSSSYPETSGYIIYTLMLYALINDRKDIFTSVTECADWLLTIQKQSGGWQGGCIADNKPETVFNTAQIIRGLLLVHGYTNNEKYLHATIKAADWLCEVQHQDGYWKKNAFMNVPRVYDSYTDYPLLCVFHVTKNEKYRNAAIKNLNWIVEKKQHANGWFEDCDNTLKHNDRPILHTISYTIDGLLDCGTYLEDERYINAAKKAADALLNIFQKNNFLHGRYDKEWNGSEYMICTGCAQIAGVWLKLHKITANEAYLRAARKMNDMLLFIQSINDSVDINCRGAIPGSFPMWGRYEPFAFPNWAAKYFADSLMGEMDIKLK